VSVVSPPTIACLITSESCSSANGKWVPLGCDGEVSTIVGFCEQVDTCFNFRGTWEEEGDGP